MYIHVIEAEKPFNFVANLSGRNIENVFSFHFLKHSKELKKS